MKTIEKLLRENIRELVPYSSARSEYSEANAIFLDANENPYNEPYSRYPDPLQLKLKVKIGQVKNVNSENIFLGNGSDEAIDLMIRAFCEPGTDNIISISPTYGMYEVCADINNVEFRKVLLKEDFQIDTEKILSAMNENTKLIFLCSPNNPTSNCFQRDDIIFLLEKFEGIVILDEAYIDFSPLNSMLLDLNNYPNLVILQTFSKAWGLAGVRLGMAFGQKAIIDVLTKIKYPYNINLLTQLEVYDKLGNKTKKDKWISMILNERERLRRDLNNFEFVNKVYPSDANFLLIKVNEPKRIYNYLVDKKIIVRDRSKVDLCSGCLRITVGTVIENDLLINALNEYKS